MDDAQRADARLTELEIKASFTEDLLDQLNAVIVRQQQQIDLLLRDMHELRARVPDPAAAQPGHGAGRLTDELPPHY